jgi:ABC-type nitrate/sulfonate/bicarbonate transport system substrate-binding protein
MRLGFGGVSIALAFLGAVTLPSAPRAQEAKELKVYFPAERSTEFYPLGVAEALGFFSEEGISLKFIQRAEGRDAADLLPTAEVDVAVLDLAETAFAYGAEIPISPAFQISYMAAYGVVTKADSAVQDAAGLKGATVGLARESDAFILNVALAASGLTKDDATTVVVGEDGAALAAALNGGKAAAVVARARDQAALEANCVAFRDLTPEAVAKAPGISFVVHQLTVEKVRPQLEGFMRAWNKATLVGESHPDVVEAIVRGWAADEWQDEAYGKALLAIALKSTVQIGEVRGELQQKPWLNGQKPLVKAKVILLPALPSAFFNTTFLEPANDFDQEQVKAAAEAWKAANADKIK